MRVALLHPYSWPTVRRGGERYLHDLARWLSDRGHDVDVVTGGDPDTARDDDGPGPRIVRVPVRVPRRLEGYGVTALETFGLPALHRLVQERYDVVHALVPSAGLAAVAALQPSVYTVLGHPSPSNPPVRGWGRALFRGAVRAVRVPAALSESAADGVEQLTGRRPVVMPPGVRTADFPARLAPRSGPPRLLFNAFAGDPRKRLGLLLRAMPQVLERHPDAVLVLGGGGDPTAAFDALDPGVRRAVEPHLDDAGPGSLADVPGRYRDATVTVLPSVDEAFGLVLVESLASGTPVVCTRSGGMPEIVTADVGRIAPPDDAGALAAAVVDAVGLAADPSVPGRCADRARAWDWSVVGPAHELSYRRARA